MLNIIKTILFFCVEISAMIMAVIIFAKVLPSFFKSKKQIEKNEKFINFLEKASKDNKICLIDKKTGDVFELDTNFDEAK